MIISLADVSVSYKTNNSLFGATLQPALNKLSLSLSEGENLGVVGSNGSGKTTLLKLIAGIIRPDTGRCTFKKGGRRSFLGLQSGFIGSMTGVENAKLTSLLLGVKNKHMKTCIDAVIQYSELGDRIHDCVFTYSAGMKARLAFAISVNSRPDLILIDEMMGVGDKAFKKKSSQTLRDMVMSDSSCVIVSHDVSYLQTVCNKILWLENGQSRIMGEADAVLKAYNG